MEHMANAVVAFATGSNVDERWNLPPVPTCKLRLVSSIVGASRLGRNSLVSQLCSHATDEARRGFLERYMLVDLVKEGEHILSFVRWWKLLRRTATSIEIERGKLELPERNLLSGTCFAKKLVVIIVSYQTLTTGYAPWSPYQVCLPFKLDSY